MGIKENFAQAVKELTGGVKDEKSTDKKSAQQVESLRKAINNDDPGTVKQGYAQPQRQPAPRERFPSQDWYPSQGREQEEFRSSESEKGDNSYNRAIPLVYPYGSYQGQPKEDNYLEESMPRAESYSEAFSNNDIDNYDNRQDYDNRQNYDNRQDYENNQNYETKEFFEPSHQDENNYSQSDYETPLVQPSTGQQQTPTRHSQQPSNPSSQSTQQQSSPQQSAPPPQSAPQQKSPPPSFRTAPISPMRPSYSEEEITVISKNTVIDGNIRSFANIMIDGDIKGDVETTKNMDLNGRVVGNLICNNAEMHTSQIQGNVRLKGNLVMERDTLLIGDIVSTYARVNGKIKGNLDISGKAEFKNDTVIFGDISASTITVDDGAIIQGYVSTTFLSKEEGINIFPETISIGE